jgi:nitronate monooxygenase
VKALKIGDLNISLPIIQGGMGIGISMSKLASAVANMGGIGVISTVGIGLTSEYQESNTNKSYIKGNIDALRAEIRKARQLTNGVIGVNIMSVITDFSEMVKTSIEEKIDIIFSGAGLPLDLPKYLKEGIKTKLVPIVSSGRAAAILCNKWYQNYNFLPMLLWWKDRKLADTWGLKPISWIVKAISWKNLWLMCLP